MACNACTTKPSQLRLCKCWLLEAAAADACLVSQFGPCTPALSAQACSPLSVNACTLHSVCMAGMLLCYMRHCVQQTLVPSCRTTAAAGSVFSCRRLGAWQLDAAVTGRRPEAGLCIPVAEPEVQYSTVYLHHMQLRSIKDGVGKSSAVADNGRGIKACLNFYRGVLQDYCDSLDRMGDGGRGDYAHMCEMRGEVQPRAKWPRSL